MGSRTLFLSSTQQHSPQTPTPPPAASLHPHPLHPPALPLLLLLPPSTVPSRAASWAAFSVSSLASQSASPPPSLPPNAGAHPPTALRPHHSSPTTERSRKDLLLAK